MHCAVLCGVMARVYVCSRPAALCGVDAVNSASWPVHDGGGGNGLPSTSASEALIRLAGASQGWSRLLVGKVEIWGGHVPDGISVFTSTATVACNSGCDVDSPPPPSVHRDADTEAADGDPFPGWFSHFLNVRQTRKPSAHTMKAYRRDFLAIATLLTNGGSTRGG
jgi:hypothetical protein